MRQKAKPDTPIQWACTAAGGQAALGLKIGRPQQTISNWVQRGYPPAHYCPDIEKATAGKVTRYDLRPDIFGDPPRPKRKATTRQQVAA
jgi:DNA-binding transcriptional regulator YdaS (Cro superfamily)